MDISAEDNPVNPEVLPEVTYVKRQRQDASPAGYTVPCLIRHDATDLPSRHGHSWLKSTHWKPGGHSGWTSAHAETGGSGRGSAGALGDKT